MVKRVLSAFVRAVDDKLIGVRFGAFWPGSSFVEVTLFVLLFLISVVLDHRSSHFQKGSQGEVQLIVFKYHSPDPSQ